MCNPSVEKGGGERPPRLPTTSGGASFNNSIKSACDRSPKPKYRTTCHSASRVTFSEDTHSLDGDDEIQPRKKLWQPQEQHYDDEDDDDGDNQTEVRKEGGKNGRNGGAGTVMKWTMSTVLAMVAIGSMVLGGHMYWQESRLQQPVSRMHSFALRERVSNDIGNIGELSVDGLKLHSQATCIQGDSVEQVRNALRLQLTDIPEQARENIVARAVVEGMDSSSTAQDTAPDTVDSSKVFSYLAYWSTTYNEQSLLSKRRYSTCVMAAGVDMKVGEVVAGFETTWQAVQVGVRACECGLFKCSRCSEYEKVETKRPVFKRHQLTLNDQIELHRWMVKQAVERAESLVYATKRMGWRWDEEDGEDDGKHVARAWSKPSLKWFSGNVARKEVEEDDDANTTTL